MKTLKVNLENCYGIKALNHQFDFRQSRACIIYAPNGVMKSSLAQAFKDLSSNVESKDRVFPARSTRREIVDESGTALSPDGVVVILPYDEMLGHPEKTSTLLVNNELRLEYAKLLVEIDDAKAKFLAVLKEISGSKRNLEQEISSTFTKTNDAFQVAVNRIKDEVREQKDAPFADVKYDTIFDDNVIKFLSTEDFKTAIQDYIARYNELLDASTYFKRGIFNYYNAETISKSLADNGFFEAQHSLSLNADSATAIRTQKDLQEVIRKEKEGITSDVALRKKFDAIDKLINKNASLRAFHQYLLENEGIVGHLANVGKFKEEVWKSYFKLKSELYFDLLERYQASDKRRKEIEEQAAKERTQWETVIEIFNRRFFVPFKLEAKNRTEVILGQDAILNLSFTFKDGDDEVPVERGELLKVLSTGEKKALYILNIIFEVEARRKASQETLFVIDDIADSFDYKNKYAIIEYLREIAEDPFLYQIILTHNFDFFRTIESRVVSYSNCFMAFKGPSGVKINKAVGIRNIFCNDWKQHFFSDVKKRVASIPFIRNIVEYTKGDSDPHFLKLTSLLHHKEDSTSITQGDLDSIYTSVFNEPGSFKDTSQSVIDMVKVAAAQCLTASDGINFENKILLCIAIRLEAESYMITKISDPDFVRSIRMNQTQALFSRFKKVPTADQKSIEVINRVILMTPESIHLNSFMYEPIIDMSDQHLRDLYREVQKL
jgi:hypothetical protein